ncbi:MAG: hypothetical protein SW127_02580 [Actinomycetota bacterium]|nr:hypothetical protein [Actinomycetota bacterium]
MAEHDASVTVLESQRTLRTTPPRRATDAVPAASPPRGTLIRGYGPDTTSSGASR